MKKGNTFVVVISILALIAMIIGTTFSFFTITTTSATSTVNMAAAEINAGVAITAEYVDKALIPLNDADVDLAYSNQCVDIHSYGACQAYDITITNDGSDMSFTGTINFNVTDIANLKYLLYDEEGNRYVNATSIVSGTNQSLGNPVTIEQGGSASFKLIIWLTNLETSQNDYDASGSFSATVSYVTPYANRITGTFTLS